MPAQYDHVRPAEETADVPDGVYRVVGSGGESVTLLRVGDVDGRRRVTGEVHRVSRDRYDADFSRAENPDSGVSPIRSLVGLIEGWYHLLTRPFRR